MTSVIIPCWINDEETWKVTNECIESFRASGEVELVVVDNASTVGAGYLRNMADIYIRYPKNLGYTVAINDGIKIANGNMLALANNDIRIAPNWIEVCREILKNTEIATVHPKMTDYDTPFTFGNTVKDDERLCQNSLTVTCHHDLLFDEGYGIGGGADDWDFALKVRKLGYSRVYTDKTCFQHKHSFSLKQLGPERQKIVEQNNALFKSKWGMEKEELFKKEGLI